MTYTPAKSPLLKPWSQLKGSAVGRWLVSQLVCFRAPYFRTIKPRLTHVAAGHVELTFRKRRGVTNHIKTVHAIAMCNAAELAGGLCMDVSLDAKHRWIPVGMQVQYLKMAKTDLRAVCKVEGYQWQGTRDVIMPVSVFDTNDIEVFHADITMRISPRR
ncbi:DUF4442 domain-containing protein [Exilibacterium tricleocarpae]|uniref:DUF4442 domain-containing protein n=1 Tax=Exilibacterium tricleocarpae TaxID=2591008 RepID=A0A545TS49_9GAMM|nr:hotdog fold domain-containing protein [Exilibacterium tricleocarpae]TQV80042.1 DUF4442 domain-containing protein [Exilibacterium tricleocarpae]